MKDASIAFIGGGNMAGSIIGGLIATGFDAQRLRVAEPIPEKRAALSARFGIRTTQDNLHAAEGASILVLAVKPQTMGQVTRQLAGVVRESRPLLISIAAGVREPDIRRWIGFDTPIVRAMPNTPALVGSGASALFANVSVSDAQRDQAESLLRAVGVTLWLEEEAQLDAVTALSGSGPAYFFLVMDILMAVGRELGLPPTVARLLTLETAFGAAKMALESEESPDILRKRVTSPGGTTEHAVAVLLENGGIARIFQTALRAARDRAVELGDTLGDN